MSSAFQSDGSVADSVTLDGAAGPRGDELLWTVALIRLSRRYTKSVTSFRSFPSADYYRR